MGTPEGLPVVTIVSMATRPDCGRSPVHCWAAAISPEAVRATLSDSRQLSHVADVALRVFELCER